MRTDHRMGAQTAVFDRVTPVYRLCWSVYHGVSHRPSLQRQYWAVYPGSLPGSLPTLFTESWANAHALGGDQTSLRYVLNDVVRYDFSMLQIWILRICKYVLREGLTGGGSRASLTILGIARLFYALTYLPM